MTILAGVTGLVVVTALGLALAFNAVAKTPSEAESVTQEPQCRGQAGCTNQYNVKLSCGDSGETKSISVLAADAEAAEAKAERYNRGCRVRSVSFVSSIIKSAARTAFGGSSTDEASPRATDNGTASRRGRWRFRRR